MSPSDPPLGLLVDTVLAPYAFCDDVPNVVLPAVPILLQATSPTLNLFELG